MHLDRTELQLLLVAARGAAYAARAEEEPLRFGLGGADALERLASRLERELVRVSAEAGADQV
jgi:hypothetical protein